MMALNGSKQNTGVYKRQYRLQESAREHNKREQRKFDIEMAGKSGIAAEYKFNVGKVNQEQRIIEKELERIRQGVHRPPGHLHTLSTEKKFHHPHFAALSAMKANAPTSSMHKNSVLEKDKGRNKSSDGSLDAVALVQYLQDFNKTYAEGEEKGLDKQVKSSGPCQPNQSSFAKHPLSDEYKSIVSNQIKSSQTENLITSNEESKGERGIDEGKIESRQRNDSSSNKHLSEEPLSKQANTSSTSPKHKTMNSKSLGSSDGRERKNDGDIGRRASHSNPSPKHDSPTMHNAQKGSEKDNQVGIVKNTTQTSAAEEVKKLTLTDPEMFNPDGSIRTAYVVPPMEQRWEEAKKARYIRTKEPLERDRQLTANEIFDKN
ncbi:hypothetical protein FSP39_001831 [Pinctada imbricata]|uniref:Uncharacterized protein n=1 Tax=Pinctada imbricata TaxID=66713 RepID=A0AA88XJV1_PINIB|nr:hypothetical protein FSP39_001831 [Pinctada imbricata]